MDKLAVIILGRFENLDVPLLDSCPPLEVLIARMNKFYVDTKPILSLLHIQHPAVVTLVTLYMKYNRDNVLIDVSDEMLDCIYHTNPEILKQYIEFLTIDENVRLPIIAHYYKLLAVIVYEHDVELTFSELRPRRNLITFYCNFFPVDTVFKYINMIEALPTENDTLAYADEYIEICKRYPFVIPEILVHPDVSYMVRFILEELY